MLYNENGIPTLLCKGEPVFHPQQFNYFNEPIQRTRKRSLFRAYLYINYVFTLFFKIINVIMITRANVITIIIIRMNNNNNNKINFPLSRVRVRVRIDSDNKSINLLRTSLIDQLRRGTFCQFSGCTTVCLCPKFPYWRSTQFHT